MMDNNPPPVPYINLNAYKTYLQRDITNELLKNYLTEIKTKLGYYENPMYFVVIQQIDDYLKYIQKKNEKEDSPIIMNCKEILKYIVQLIDNLNSASVIGTLEYMDRVMKLNNTNILCENESQNSKQDSTSNNIKKIDEHFYDERLNNLSIKSKKSKKSKKQTKPIKL
jgi:hypothetical protein